MKNKNINLLIKIAYNTSAVLVLLGAFFKLSHYPHGSLIFTIGFISGMVTMSIENYSLKKKIKELEKENQNS